MKTLIIYDNTGYILMTQSGGYRIPEGGIQYSELEIPKGKRVVSIDMENNTPVYDDIPKSETQLLQEKVEKLENNMADLMLEMATQRGNKQN